jgi:hypothetical protein
MTTQNRGWVILIGILSLELVPLTLTFRLSPRGVVGRVYGFDPSHWLAWVAGSPEPMWRMASEHFQSSARTS